MTERNWTKILKKLKEIEPTCKITLEIMPDNSYILTISELQEMKRR